MKDSNFRQWITKIWFEHKDEILDTTKRPCDYDVQEYFTKYKWWLKREYKSQVNK